MISVANKILIPKKSGVLINIAVGFDGGIYTSLDGGSSFTYKSITGNQIDIGVSLGGQYVSLVSAGSSNQIRISSDYASTFTSRGTARKYKLLQMSDSGQYAVCTSSETMADGYIFTSSNYGVTWYQRGSLLRYYGLAMSRQGAYQFASTNTAFYRSSNYGVNWFLVSSSMYFTLINCSGTGQYVMRVYDTTNSIIFISSNYGNTWTTRDTSTRGNSRGSTISYSGEFMYCLRQDSSNDTVWYLFYSSDYGVNWNSYTLPSNLYYGDQIACSNCGQYVFLYVSMVWNEDISDWDPAGHLYKSDNYGLEGSWSYVNSLVQGNYIRSLVVKSI